MQYSILKGTLFEKIPDRNYTFKNNSISLRLKINLMSVKNPIGQNMMLISSSFRNVKSFTLVPVTDDCVYVEAMYDPTAGILAVLTKTKNNHFI